MTKHSRSASVVSLPSHEDIVCLSIDQHVGFIEACLYLDTAAEMASLAG
jgi:hypothetical protein